MPDNTEEPINHLDHIDTQAERIRLLYRGIPTAIILNVTLAILVFWILWGAISQQTTLYLWTLTLSVVLLSRAYSYYRFNQVSPNDKNIQAWYFSFLIQGIISGLIWGCLIWLFTPYTQNEIPFFITFVLAGITAGAISTMGAVLSVYVSYLLSALIPLSIWFLSQFDSIHFSMAGMIIVFILALIIGGNRYQKILVTSLDLSNDLLVAKDQAEVANQAKSQFLSNMSHELRTPLNAVLGYAQLLQMEEDLSKENKEAVEEIHKGGSHLLALVNSLLDLAKIEARQIELHEEKLDCNKLILDCIEMIKPLQQQHSVNVKAIYPTDLKLSIWADNTRLKQVILNLLSNACKYNKPGGEVFIDCKSIDTNKVHICIKDTGLGISKANQKKLFQTYERLGHENSLIEGTGLGLNIIKQIIDLMHGTINFTSTEHEGSSFWIELPASKKLA